MSKNYLFRNYKSHLGRLHVPTRSFIPLPLFYLFKDFCFIVDHRNLLS